MIVNDAETEECQAEAHALGAAMLGNKRIQELSPDDVRRQAEAEARYLRQGEEERGFMKRSTALQAALQLGCAGDAASLVREAAEILAFLDGASTSTPQSH